VKAGRDARSKDSAHGAAKPRPLTKSGRVPRAHSEHQRPPLRRSTGRRPGLQTRRSVMTQMSHPAYALVRSFF